MENNKCGNVSEVSNSGIPVVHAVNSEDERKRKMTEILLIVAAVILVVAIVVAVITVKKKKEELPVNENVAEETAGFIPVTEKEETEENNDNAPVTLADDVTITFEGISSTYADDLLEHATMATSTVAFKPETTTSAAVTTTKKQVKPKVETTKYLEETTVMTEKETQGFSKAESVIEGFFDRKYYLDGTMISNGEKTPIEMAMDGDSFQVFSEMDGQDVAIMNLDGDIYLLNPDTKKYTQ